MPRVLARLPYGAETVPVKGFAFEEEVEKDHNKYVWMNAAFPMGVNINRSHKLFGWGTQIRGVENGGSVINLPVHSFPTDDGSIAMKCPSGAWERVPADEPCAAWPSAGSHGCSSAPIAVAGARRS